MIGRAPDLAVRMQDASVSRRHARLLIDGDSVAVSDLESHNGTRVNGSVVSGNHPLDSGDVISLSDEVSLVFHTNPRASESRTLSSPSALRVRLEEEVERCARFRRTVGVVALRFAVDPQNALAALAGHFRLIDSAAWISRRELLLVLPERSRNEVIDAAQRGRPAHRRRCVAHRASGGPIPRRSAARS